MRCGIRTDDGDRGLLVFSQFDAFSFGHGKECVAVFGHRLQHRIFAGGAVEGIDAFYFAPIGVCGIVHRSSHRHFQRSGMEGEAGNMECRRHRLVDSHGIQAGAFVEGQFARRLEMPADADVAQ